MLSLTIVVNFNLAVKGHNILCISFLWTYSLFQSIQDLDQDLHVISSPVLSFFLSFLCYVPHKLCKVAVRECGGEKMDAATLSRFILSALQSLRLRSEKWRGCNRGITLRPHPTPRHPPSPPR